MALVANIAVTIASGRQLATLLARTRELDEAISAYQSAVCAMTDFVSRSRVSGTIHAITMDGRFMEIHCPSPV